MTGLKQPRGRPPHPDVLTPAEWQVVEAVRHGLSNRQIAVRRGISLDAVKFHVANAVLKLGLENRRALRRWGGVRRGSAMSQGEGTMTQPLKLSALGQIARSVADVAAARAFFADKLGVAHLYSFGNLAFFDCGGVRLMLSEGDGAGAESILYFRVEGIHAALVELASRGVAVEGAPHLIHRHADGTEEWLAIFSDNEGRPLALIEQVRSKA